MGSQIYISRDSLVMNHFPSWGIDGESPRIWLPKAKYAVFTTDFIAGEFSQKLAPWIEENVGPYDLEDGETDPGPHVCEDFAQACSFFMMQSFRGTGNRQPGGGPGWGPFAFKRDSDGKNHSLNCWLCLIDGKLSFAHYEPQRQQIVEISPAEVQNFLNFRMAS